MNLTSKIGIAVSGCKNGYAVLATDNIDANSPLLKQGLRDQRSYMRVTEPGHDFYTMTICPDTLVLSACRSSVDAVGSSGGYIAVSVFVPVNIQVRKAATLLHSMLEAYWTEYMHPMFGSPLRDKFENAYPLRQILDKAQDSCSIPAIRYKVFPSETQKPPLFCEFTGLAEVDAAMANPFHRVYAQGAEVIFIPKGFMNTPVVNHNLESINYVSIQRTLPLTAMGRLMVPAGAAFSVADYTVDGKSYPSPADVSLTAGSRLAYSLILPSGEKKVFDGSLQEAIQLRMVAKKGDDYELLPPRITVHLSVTGLAPGMAVGLNNGRRDPAEGFRRPDGLWEFKIPCSGFPYSLVETKNGRAIRTLVRDAVTQHNVGQTVIEAKVMPSGGVKSLGGGGSRKDFKLTKPMIIAIGAVALALIGFLVWLFFLRTPDTPESSDSTETTTGSTTTGGESNDSSDKDKSQTPEYCYIVIPAETLAEHAQDYHDFYITSEVLEKIDDVAVYENGRTKVIRLSKGHDKLSKDKPLEISILAKNGQVINKFTLDKTNLVDGQYDDLMKFPANTKERYVVRPMKEEALTAEMYEKYKNFDPSGKDFKPMKPVQNSGETGGNVSPATSKQQTNPAVDTKTTTPATGAQGGKKPKPTPNPTPKPTPNPTPKPVIESVL